MIVTFLAKFREYKISILLMRGVVNAFTEYSFKSQHTHLLEKAYLGGS